MAQAARGESARLARLEAWRAAAEQHRPGRIDQPLLEISTWRDEHLETVVTDVGQLSRFLARAHLRLLQSGRISTVSIERRPLSMLTVQQLLGLNDEEARGGDVSRLALRGALLHTDIATLVDDRRERRTPSGSASSSRRAAVLVLDGQEHGERDRAPHWELARDLIDLLPDDSAAIEMARRWYVAAAAYMQSRLLLSDMYPHMGRALARFPEDAALRFYAGSMHETSASPVVQAATPDIRLPPGVKLAIGSAEIHLRQALRFFESAVEADVQLPEARLRLGRALLLAGRYDEAAEQLNLVLDTPPDEDGEYFAALFLGEVEASRGREDRARRAFERAAALFPGAQSPRLALSSLSRERGDKAAAVTVLLDALARSEGDPARFDPWWEYFSGSEETANRLLNEWSVAVVRPGGS
jgi:tetratricopeptide (TPR) repeat protein